ncbi:uncharacterized protein [Diadema antillarum]|uniref:uncharacterized protein n=1 Tax=Diadema antillarum TaxID=105358 RepID=UPI003A8A3BFF
MWCATDNQVIKAMAQFLHSMSDSHSARQTMIREELPPSLEGRCISERTSQDTKDACLELLGVLDEHEIHEASLASSQRMPPSTELSFPKTHPTGQSPGSPQTAPLDGRGDASGEVEGMEFDDMPPLVDSEEELEIAHPKVLWSQRPNSVLLSVQLRGVVNPEVHVTTNSISFCAILGSMQYEFELALFSRVDSSNFVVAPAGGEVLITLYKESIGIKWTRLTHSKKLPFVGIDFERWKDDDDLESERKKVKQRAPKKAPGRIAEPGSEEETSEEESSEDFSDFSGDEFDKAFEDISHSSEEKQETGYSS